MEKKTYFAANAPTEIPRWFEPILEPKPTAPKAWDQMKWENEEDKGWVRDWHRDPIFDLPEHLSWYQKQWDAHNEVRRDWEKKYEQQRFFQWRWFYAEQMLNSEPNLEPSVATGDAT
jgi:glycine/D-amino acid oxidase-like deaminating enzyme